jgi:hypothetical protein
MKTRVSKIRYWIRLRPELFGSVAEVSSLLGHGAMSFGE